MIKAADLEALRAMIAFEFARGLQSAESLWQRVATRITSNTKQNTYGWLSKSPALRKWVGDRRLKEIKEQAYTLVNDKYEGTLEVDRTDIEDDNLGAYASLSRSVGQECNDHIDRKVFEALKAGRTSLCYDGQFFFDTDHPVYPNHDGTGAAKSISNIINPLVTTGPEWFLLNTKRPLKPLIFQERTAPEIEMITDPKQDTVFMKDVYLYGARTRRAFGYGFWQQAVASRDALNEANFDAAYAAMGGVTRDGGDPIGVKPDLLVVPMSLRSKANAVIEVMNKANGASNPNYKAVELLVCAWL